MSANDERYSGAGAGSYENYDQDHRYEYDNGLTVLPVAGRTAKYRIIRLHGGIGIRRVKFDAQRRGKPPVIPAMADTGYDTFIGGTLTASVPSPNFQVAGYNWRVQGEYVFVQTTPRIAGTNTIPTGGFPFPVAPNDALASTIVSPQSGVFSAATGNPYEAVMEAVGSSLVDHDTEQYVWPFTAMPTVFTSDNLIGK